MKCTFRAYLCYLWQHHFVIAISDSPSPPLRIPFFGTIFLSIIFFFGEKKCFKLLILWQVRKAVFLWGHFQRYTYNFLISLINMKLSIFMLEGLISEWRKKKCCHPPPGKGIFFFEFIWLKWKYWYLCLIAQFLII